MKALLKLDKRFMLFLLLLPIIWDVVLRDYRNNELIQLLWILLVYLWQLGAGKALFKKNVEIKKTAFIIFQLIFVSLILYAILSEFTDIDLDNYIMNSNFIIKILGVLAYLWSIYFITVRLLKLEDRQGKKSDGVITFVLIFVVPIGIWWIQPRMQAVINKTQTV